MLVLETAIGNAIVRVTFKRGEYQVSKTIEGASTFINTNDKHRAIELTNQFINDAKGVKSE
jgi:hypothetical protein